LEAGDEIRVYDISGKGIGTNRIAAITYDEQICTADSDPLRCFDIGEERSVHRKAIGAERGNAIAVVDNDFAAGGRSHDSGKKRGEAGKR